LRQQEIVSTQQELDAAKYELRELQGTLAGMNDDKEKKQQELNEMAEQLGNVRSELRAEREERKDKMAGVRERLVELSAK
jgi:predicted  nucleic acid-binding Zn-ribbon protein